MTCQRSILLVGLFALFWGGTGHGGQAQDVFPVGSELPSVEGLQRVDGTSIAVGQLVGSGGTVFLFWSNRCPWVDRYEGRVQSLVSEFQGEGIRFILVNANDADAFPSEGRRASLKHARERDYRATYVRDTSAVFARALGAAVTPEAFVFDRDGTLVYRGAIDDSPSGASRLEESYLREVVEALSARDESPLSRQKAYGCTVKAQE